jgi:spore germination protein YaaH
VMAYDEHWTGSDSPGSVSSLNWTEEGIKQQLEYGIPRSKLILGIPFYTREWKLDSKGKLVGNKTLLMKDIPSRVAQTKATSTYDEKAGQYRYSYQQDGHTYIFWAETTETVLARIALAKKYDLAGVAAWRLGYEDGALWEAMLKVKEQ